MRTPDSKYELLVLIGNEPQREYEHKGRTYVIEVPTRAVGPSQSELAGRQESKLDTPHTKMVDLTEKTPFSEKEVSRWPVTPYQIKIGNFGERTVGVKVYIDGSEVAFQAVLPGTHHIVDGIRTPEGVKELLFSFPRYVRDEYDRMPVARLSKLGTISATFHPATSSGMRMGYSSAPTSDFQQGNKKDADLAGGNKFTSTTRPGDVLRQHTPSYGRYEHYECDVSTVLGELSVTYKVATFLRELGISVEERDIATENRRLYGKSFDPIDLDMPGPATAAPAAASARAGSAGARAGSAGVSAGSAGASAGSAGASASAAAAKPASAPVPVADRPIKQRKLDPGETES